MKKLSIKIGAIFFFCILGLESFMFFFLHSALVDSRVGEELNALQARGNSHRSVLQKHFTPESIEHVALMETESTTDVVITDNHSTILGTSNEDEILLHYVQLPNASVPVTGMVVEKNWTKEPYIVTVSPIQQNGQSIGYVYMFQNTETVHSLILRLNQHFLLAGLLTVLLTFLIIAVLSRALTRPLIDMKNATYELSRGNYSISLPKTADDELGDLSRSIERLANELNYLTMERNDFLASISHELRTPLTYIKGYSEIALKRDLPADELKGFLQIISDESNRLNGLIKNLFELAKIDRNSFHIDQDWVNFPKLLNRIQLKLQPAFQEREMELLIHCRPELMIWADAERMEQVLLNLLDNSMKYSTAGGVTMITVDVIDQEVVILVSDRGKGIPASELSHVFDRFYRVDKSRTRSLGGSGLGLAIVKELVLAHDGEISVTSKEEEGSTFKIVLKGGHHDANDTTSR